MFRNLVRERREARGLTQTKLASRLGVAQGVLSDIELGKRYPWPKLRKELALVLDMNERTLFTGNTSAPDSGVTPPGG